MDLEFKSGNWNNVIDVSNFIDANVTPYYGNEDFLRGVSDKTNSIYEINKDYLKKEREKGVYDIEIDAVGGINNFKPGFIDKENEVIYGYQTDTPYKRIVNISGGKRMALTSLEVYKYELNKELFNGLKYIKTHNDGVFDAYTEDMKKARSAGLLTGLPDAYGRGRIIGDYRRVALYGIDKLIEEKKNDLSKIDDKMLDDSIRLREEVNEQIRALNETKLMAASYGFDISKKALNAKETIQWLYFGYLASVKESNGAAMSLGRVSTFIDIFIERDIQNGILTEEEAQELVDQFVLKLRSVRHLRTPEYDNLFAGDPTWVTESIGGMKNDGVTPLVTKTSFRFLHTLVNLGPSPEPNMTILWSENLPENFKKFCAKISILTDSIQYENDDLMRPIYGDDYGIACCISAMKIGKQMQFFGARCNLAKALLYSINGGIDEVTGKKVVDGFEIMTDEVLDYDKVLENYNNMLTKLTTLYAKTMNVIHYMHDKYAYERIQMGLHDTNIEHLMAFGVAGLSVATDSLSAIKYAKVKPIRNDEGIAIDFEIIGEYPKYGNDDDKVDDIAVMITDKFYELLCKNRLYKNAKHTLSVLTITSNVVYGDKTGSTPDGRAKGVAFAPGANPMHQRDVNGALASLNSVAKIKYCSCQDGVSNTFSIVPSALGKTEEDRVSNLVSIMDGYFSKGAQHLNVNVLNKELLIDAMNNIDKYPTLTIRVSGYAVNFNRLNRKQQEEVISRTFHESC